MNVQNVQSTIDEVKSLEEFTQQSLIANDPIASLKIIIMELTSLERKLKEIKENLATKKGY